MNRPAGFHCTQTRTHPVHLEEPHLPTQRPTVKDHIRPGYTALCTYNWSEAAERTEGQIQVCLHEQSWNNTGELLPPMCPGAWNPPSPGINWERHSHTSQGAAGTVPTEPWGVFRTAQEKCASHLLLATCSLLTGRVNPIPRTLVAGELWHQSLSLPPLL